MQVTTTKVAVIFKGFPEQDQPFTFSVYENLDKVYVIKEMPWLEIPINNPKHPIWQFMSTVPVEIATEYLNIEDNRLLRIRGMSPTGTIEIDIELGMDEINSIDGIEPAPRRTAIRHHLQNKTNLIAAMTYEEQMYVIDYVVVAYNIDKVMRMYKDKFLSFT